MQADEMRWIAACMMGAAAGILADSWFDVVAAVFLVLGARLFADAAVKEDRDAG
jgi:hypothetical protein